MDFAVRIVELYKFLVEQKKEYIMSKQLLRAGTSIGANVHEGEYAESKADFVHKNSIALKEANESLYWLELLFRTKYISTETYDSYTKDNKEIISILVATIKTCKLKMKKVEWKNINEEWKNINVKSRMKNVKS